MLSDDSNSDSDTGRFKGRTKKAEEASKQNINNARGTGRNRYSENNGFHKSSLGRKYNNVMRSDNQSEDRDRGRYMFNRHSPVERRYLRDVSPRWKSYDRKRHRESILKSKQRDYRCEDKQTCSRYNTYKLHHNRQDSVDGNRRITVRDKFFEYRIERSRENRNHKRNRSEIYKSPPVPALEKKASERKRSGSPIIIENNAADKEIQCGSYRKMITAVVKKQSEESSEIDSSDDERLRAKLLEQTDLHSTKNLKKHKKQTGLLQTVRVPEKKRSDSPIIIKQNDPNYRENVQLGSYYMIPVVVKENSEESSEIDSSDDERLRAKLLNLQKELHRTKNLKKHKRKHKGKSSNSKKEKKGCDTERGVVTCEVTSTTDIEVKHDVSSKNEVEVVKESTQKCTQKDDYEEGEISSDDSLTQVYIDPTAFKYKYFQWKSKAYDQGKHFFVQ